MPNEVFSVISFLGNSNARRDVIYDLKNLFSAENLTSSPDEDAGSGVELSRIEFTTAWRPIETTRLLDVAYAVGLEKMTYAWWETGMLGWGRSELVDGAIKSKYYSLDLLEYSDDVGDDEEPKPIGKFAKFLDTYFPDDDQPLAE